MYERSTLVETPDRAQEIWRYMDLGKFVSLLQRRELFFASAESMEDPYEGAQPEAAMAWLRELPASLPAEVRKLVPPDLVTILARAGKAATYDWGISCWHCNDGESAAMWDLYASRHSGIAIQSTVERLCESFGRAPGSQLVGKVRYADYSTESRILTGTVEPVMTKRKSFQHEEELRALVHPLSEIRKRAGEPEDLRGTYVPVDLAQLIEDVYVAPRAPVWFAGAVRSVVTTYGLTCPVRQSPLYTGPLY